MNNMNDMNLTLIITIGILMLMAIATHHRLPSKIRWILVIIGLIFFVGIPLYIKCKP